MLAPELSHPRVKWKVYRRVRAEKEVRPKAAGSAEGRFHVQPKHEAIMRKAVENGKRLEAPMARAGVDLVMSLRESND